MILKTLILCEDMLPVVMCISISPSLRPVPWIGYWCPDLFSLFVRNTPFHNVLQKALDRLVFSNLSLGLCVVIAIWSYWHEHRYFPFSTFDDLLVCLAPSSPTLLLFIWFICLGLGSQLYPVFTRSHGSLHGGRLITVTLDCV